MDAVRQMYGLAFFINSSRDPNLHMRELGVNSYLKLLGLPRIPHEAARSRPPVVALFARQRIEAGEELFW